MFKRVVVAVQDTFALPGYENIKPMIELEWELQPGESLKDAYSRLSAAARALQIKEIATSLAIRTQITKSKGIHNWVADQLEAIEGDEDLKGLMELYSK